MRSKFITLIDIRLGALFWFGASHRLSREALVALMVDRVGYPWEKSQQLVAHWLTTEPYRKGTPK